MKNIRKFLLKLCKNQTQEITSDLVPSYFISSYYAVLKFSYPFLLMVCFCFSSFSPVLLISFLQIYAFAKMFLSGIGSCVQLAWWHTVVTRHNQLISECVHTHSKPDMPVWHETQLKYFNPRMLECDKCVNIP